MEMIRGRQRPIEMAKAGFIQAARAEAKLDMSIHNRFDIEVVDANTGKTKQKAYAENVICDQLWTRMFSTTAGNRAWNNYIHYGSGTGTPSGSDSSLFTFVGYGTPSSGDDVQSIDGLLGVYSYTRKIQLSETTAVGVTLTEVGIGYATSSASLCTHAMLKDMNGNQISIAKTDTDIISIYATVFVHWPPEGFDSGHIQLGISTGNLFLRWIAGITWPTLSNYYGYGGSMMAAGSSSGTYTFSSSEKKLTMTFARRSVSDSNLAGGIRSLNWGAESANHLFFRVGGSWYPFTTITGEAIGTGDGVKKDFKTACGLAHTATIYADGVPVDGVTVDYLPYDPQNMGLYFLTVNNDGTLSLTGSRLFADGIASSTSTAFNPYYELGIVSFYASNGTTVSVSDDLTNWTTLTSGTAGTVSVPAEYRNYKYWRRSASGNGTSNAFTVGVPVNNVHFDITPASGAVVTADYMTDTIAKDTNHVFDFEVTVTVNEKTT